MNKFFTGLFIFLGVISFGFIVGFCVWTEVKHDKSAYRYIKDQIETKNDTEVKDEVVTENEDGTATAIINF